MTSWADEREILNLLFRYCELQDAADFAGVAELFRHSAYRVHEGDEHHGYDEVYALKTKHDKVYDDGTLRTKHITHNTIVEFDARERRPPRSVFTVYQATPELPLQCVITGRYHDTFEKVDEHWRFRDRLIIGDLVGDLTQHCATTPWTATDGALRVMDLPAATPATLFVAFADPPADRDAEFNEWYDTVHGPDALGERLVRRHAPLPRRGRRSPRCALPRTVGRTLRVGDRGLGVHRPRAGAARSGSRRRHRFGAIRAHDLPRRHAARDRGASRYRHSPRSRTTGATSPVRPTRRRGGMQRASRRSTRRRGGWSPATRPGGVRATTSRCSRTPSPWPTSRRCPPA